MSYSNPLSRYAEQAGRVAREMLKEPDNTPVTFGNAVPGSLEVFRWAGRHVHQQARLALGDTVPPIIKKRNVLNGMLVISRFVYMSALQARKLGLGSDTFLGALTHPSTCTQTLGAIAMQDNRVSVELELSYGLCYNPNPAALTLYSFETNAGISLLGLESLTRDHRERLRAQGETIQEDAICAAHKAGVLEGIFDAVAPVYATHPELGGAIFSGADTTTRVPTTFAGVVVS